MLANKTKKNTKIINAKLDYLLHDISKTKSNNTNKDKTLKLLHSLEEEEAHKFSRIKWSKSHGNKDDYHPHWIRFLQGGNIGRVLNFRRHVDIDGISKRRSKKKKNEKPYLNCCEKDDTIDYGYIYNDDSEDESLESIQRESTTDLRNDEKELHKHNSTSTNDHFEGSLDRLSSVSAIDNEEYHCCNISIGMGRDDSTGDWNAMTEKNKCEWEIVPDNDEQSVDGFYMIHSFDAFSYKDVLLKLDTTSLSQVPHTQKPVEKCARPMCESRKVPRRHTMVRSRNVIRPILLEDKEDEIFDFYFDYDGYKGARGGKTFANSALKNSAKVDRRPKKSYNRKPRWQ